MIVAYIDPGSGSMIFQVLLAAVLAVPFFLRDRIGRAVDRIRGRRSPAEQDPSEGDG